MPPPPPPSSSTDRRVPPIDLHALGAGAYARPTPSQARRRNGRRRVLAPPPPPESGLKTNVALFSYALYVCDGDSSTSHPSHCLSEVTTGCQFVILDAVDIRPLFPQMTRKPKTTCAQELIPLPDLDCLHDNCPCSRSMPRRFSISHHTAGSHEKRWGRLAQP
jgi:hypothetical protein